MKFNTITLDANLPTVQQVNVPTNTDYKVGMKVKRNGTVQSINPSEFTIYTGETTHEEPETAALEKTFESGYYTVRDDGLLLYDNFGGIEPEKLYPIITNATVTVGGQTLQINAGDIGMSLDSPAGQWKRYEVDGKIVWKEVNTSETRDYVETAGYDLMIELPKAKYAANGFTTALEQSAASNGYSGSATIVTKPAEDVPVTYPVDAEKTNGYVTMTKASNDDANFRQLSVHIEHGYDFNDYTERHTGQFGSTAVEPNPAILKVKASDLGLTGYTVKAEEYKNVHRYTWRKATPVPADLSAWTYRQYIWPQTQPYPPEQPWPIFKFSEWDGRDVYIGCPVNDVTFDNETDDPGIKGRTVKKGVYYFFITDEERIKLVDFFTEHTFAADDYVIVSPGLTQTKNYYYGQCYEMTFGTPFSADFKLNVNEFKSQQGDIAETLADSPTVNVDGTYADGTSFSFDFYTK